MKFLKIFLLDFKLLLKNKMFYIKLILFPLLLIAILGSVFKSNADIKITTFTIAYLNEDKPITSMGSTSLGGILEQNVLKSDDVKSTINVVDVPSDAKGKQMLRDGKAAFYIRVPAGFTEGYANGDQVKIDNDDENAQSIQKDFVNAILKNFAEGIDTEINLQKAAISESKTFNISSALTQQVMSELATDKNSDYTIPVESPNGDKQPISSMQYESVAMTVMFSIMTAFILIHSVVDEKLNKTFFRIESTPLRKSEYAAGKLLGLVFSVTLQMLILILFTTLVYRTNWGNPFLVLLITIVYSMAIGSVVLVAGLLAKDQTSVSSYSTLILFGLSFLGGSFIPADNFSAGLFKIHQIIPNGAAIDAFISVANGGGIENISGNLICIALYAAVFACISVLIQNKFGGAKIAIAHTVKLPD